MGYQETLHDELLPFVTVIEDEKTILQQDNVPIYAAATTRKWFQDFVTELLRWSAFSSDLNSMENLRGILARQIYDQEESSIES